MELSKELKTTYSMVDLSKEGFTIDINKLIDYLLAVYVKDENEEHVTLNQKKEAQIIKLKIPSDDANLLLTNKSITASRIITEILKHGGDRLYEMYISGLEAATILLEVVRRPINDDLDDEKWFSALRAKKQGFIDARELYASTNQIAEEMLGVKEVDIETHVDTTDYTQGISEILAKKASKKK